MENTAIGRTFGTEKKPNTAYTFNFWTEPGAKIGIGTLVKVVTPDTTAYGVVVEALGFNDLESPLHEFMALGESAGGVPPTERPEVRVFEGAVLHRVPEEPIGAVPIGEVFEASEADVRAALRTEKYVENFGIPAGVYGPKDGPISIHLDSRFLLGPEAGHLNITGTSGLAAKTSYVLFLLQSIFQTYRDEPDAPGAKGVAALLFNTKGGDLLYLDKEPNDLDDLDNGIYASCGLEPAPFSNVRYYAPFDNDQHNLATLRRNQKLEEKNPTMPFSFGIKEVVKHAEVLLNKDDLDAKAGGYLDFLNDRYVLDASPADMKEGGPKVRANTLKKLIEIMEIHVRHAEQDKSASTFSGHSLYTIRKILRRFSALQYRFSGLISENGETTGPFDQPFQDRTLYVVDIADLDTESQDLVFAAFITMLKERMEDGNLGVGKLVVMLDELNKYAPTGGGETYVLRALKEIAARGRYLGLTLFGAQQFRSRVDKEIIGNAATHAFGHVEAEELAQPGYSYFSASVKEKLGALNPGETLLKHPHFKQPIFVRFPRPSCLKGSEGMKQYPREPKRTHQELILDLAKAKGGNIADCNDRLSRTSLDPDNLNKILVELRRTGNVDAAFKVAKFTAAVSQQSTPMLEDRDPFAAI